MNQTIRLSWITFGVLILLFTNCKKQKTDPFLVWTKPAEIRFGTALSAIQLNALADVPGSYLYIPSFGTKLDVGTDQVLKVEFTPSDASSFNSVTKTIKITVVNAGILFNPNLTYGSVSDLDGNTYKTITIGSQTWIAENLRTTTYQNGDPIENIKENSAWASSTSGAYCNYKNTTDIDSIKTFGRLYNWYAAIDPRGIAPQGWHVPSDSEWKELQTYLGDVVPNHQLKEASSTDWTTINADDNTSGFSAFPCGMRLADNGQFTYLINEIYWLSSTPFNTTSFISWSYNGTALIQKGPTAGGAGWSLRCLKD